MLGRDELSGAVYREVFNGIDDGLVLLDPDTGRIVDANGSFVDLAGSDRESLVGRTLVSVTNNESRAAVAYAVTMVERAAAGDPQSFEWTDRGADGEEVELDVDFSPVTVGGSRLVLGVVHDVTAERERERALLRRKERLEEFASVVSHDLRGPLNVVEGELHRYRETGAVEHLDAVEAASYHLDRVVTDLLGLARNGQTVGEMESTSLEEVARRAWTLVDGRGSTLVVTEDATLRADPVRLTRALENLFRNSVEHSSASSRARTDATAEQGSTNSHSRADRRAVDGLEVRVGPLPDGDGFFVGDDGPGIPAAERERAFDPGFSTAADGTGLGLAIVHRIVEAHGWSVEATESESGGARLAVRGVTLGTPAEQ